MAAPGPLPNPRRRRRNAPTIPTTDLPAAGRSGSAPRCPKWIDLGPSGTAWWRWAWHTPQAAAWSAGDHPLIARRAVLEDMIAARKLGDVGELAELLGLDADHIPDGIEAVFTALAELAGGALSIMREAREIEDRLGLTPKGMAQLRWRIVPDVVEEDAEDDELAKRREGRRARLASGGS